MFGHVSDETLDVNTSGKELTHVRQNGDLRWLRPDGKTQVIEYVPQVVDEIIEVVRLISQERVQQRTVEQNCPRPRTTSRGRNSGNGPDHSPEAYLEAYHRPNCRCASGDATPSADHPESSEDVEVLQVQFLD